MTPNDYYDSLLEDLDELPRDPNPHGAFAGGPPILSPEEARRLFEDPEDFERRAREALKKARQRFEAETVQG